MGSTSVGMVSDSTSSASTSTEKAAENSILGKDSFLKILVAQMSNQDPLEPLDSAEFIAQMAQFAEVEQTTNLNDKLENLGEYLRFSAASLVGSNVTFTDSDGEEKDDTVQSVIFEDESIMVKVASGEEVSIDRISHVS
ncbi:MAG: flagellar hook assembly protein FlgD [Thermovirga sp.]